MLLIHFIQVVNAKQVSPADVLLDIAPACVVCRSAEVLLHLEVDADLHTCINDTLMLDLPRLSPPNTKPHDQIASLLGDFQQDA